MRLLQVGPGGVLSLVERVGNSIPPYAILSHTWGNDEDEVTYRDMIDGKAMKKPGYRKLDFCRGQANYHGLGYFWVDTCCIDKSSSAELSEAINSMFRWYQSAAICYVYLSDVHSREILPAGNYGYALNWNGAFRNSKWFTRGWTLQEMIGPKDVLFFSAEGENLGRKVSLMAIINQITGVPVEVLQGSRIPSNFTIDERMSWADGRTTKREEDAAYSLLGIFDIHLPLIYGEGRQRAFRRLQKEIREWNEDEPIFRLPKLSKSDPEVRRNREIAPVLDWSLLLGSRNDHDGQKGSPAASSTTLETSSKCDNCRDFNFTCNGERPRCDLCTSWSLDCKYTPVRRPRPKAKRTNIVSRMAETPTRNDFSGLSMGEITSAVPGESPEDLRSRGDPDEQRGTNATSTGPDHSTDGGFPEFSMSDLFPDLTNKSPQSSTDSHDDDYSHSTMEAKLSHIPMWPGRLNRDYFENDYVQNRDKIADAAKEADWTSVFQLLEIARKKYSENWTNTVRLGSYSKDYEPSCWTPLHQAAFLAAPVNVVTELISRGSFRTIRTRRSRFSNHDLTAAEIAHAEGYAHLDEILAPIIYHPIPYQVLDRLQNAFHDMIRAENEDMSNVILPDLVPLTELRVPEMWFPLKQAKVKIGLRVFNDLLGYLYRLENRQLVVTRLGPGSSYLSECRIE